MRWVYGAVFVVVGCASSYGAQNAPDPLTNDGGVGVDAATPGDGGLGADGHDAADLVETGTDAADAAPARPFDNFVVLRFETDAPNGLQPTGAWRDLSKAARTVTVVAGTPSVQFSGDAGAQGMLFGATGAPIFEVPDSADLRFGASDDFFVVARATIEVPAGTGGGCTFQYLFSKYGADGTTGPHLRVCADVGRNLIGSLKLVATDAKIAVPVSLTTTYGVVSFGRNLNGTRIETYGGGTSNEVAVASPVDVSTTGSPFMVGGFRSTPGAGPGGAWFGKVNRLYVYHAPGGTFTATDFATIRAYVSGAAPRP